MARLRFPSLSVPEEPDFTGNVALYPLITAYGFSWSNSSGHLNLKFACQVCFGMLCILGLITYSNVTAKDTKKSVSQASRKASEERRKMGYSQFTLRVLLKHLKSGLLIVFGIWFANWLLGREFTDWLSFSLSVFLMACLVTLVSVVLALVLDRRYFRTSP